MLHVKIAGPEILFAYLLHIVNVVCGVVVFTVFMETSPEYASTMAKIERASGFSMSSTIYLVCPLSLLLSALTRLVYHSTSEVERDWKQ